MLNKHKDLFFLISYIVEIFNFTIRVKKSKEIYSGRFAFKMNFEIPIKIVYYWNNVLHITNFIA
jgi:hypothetical protein